MLQLTKPQSFSAGVAGAGLSVVTHSYSAYQNIRSGQYGNAGFETASSISSLASLGIKISPVIAASPVVGSVASASGAISIAHTYFEMRSHANQGQVLQVLADGGRLTGQVLMGTAGAMVGGVGGFNNGVTAANFTQGVGQILADKYLVPYMVKHLNDPSHLVGKLNAWLPQ